MTTGSCFCNCEQAKKRSGSAKRIFEQDFSFALAWPVSGRAGGQAVPVILWSETSASRKARSVSAESCTVWS